METLTTLTTLKVIHVAATVVLLLSGLGLALLAWRKRSVGAAAIVQRPWAFVWLLMGICVISMPFTGWWLVHLIGWPLGQTWILGSSILYTVAALAWFWLVARLNRLRKGEGEGGSLNFTLVLAVVSLVGFVAIAGLMGAKPV